MPLIEKMLVITGVARGIYGRWRFRQMLHSVLMTAGCGIVTAILIGTMLASSLYAAWSALIHYGMPPERAALLIGLLCVLLTLAFILLTLMSLRRLRDIPNPLFGKSTVSGRFDDVVDAFFEGLTGKDPR